MRFVIQRVAHASVTVDGEKISEIGKGIMVLAGICKGDDRQTADKLIHKMCGLRIFEDEEGKTNLSLETVGGEILIVSQFTLYADCRKGNRPSFTDAADPAQARELYEYILEETRKQISSVQPGCFGASMKIDMQADGPFTVILDSEMFRKDIKK